MKQSLAVDPTIITQYLTSSKVLLNPARPSSGPGPESAFRAPRLVSFPIPESTTVRAAGRDSPVLALTPAVASITVSDLYEAEGRDVSTLSLHLYAPRQHCERLPAIEDKWEDVVSQDRSEEGRDETLRRHVTGRFRGPSLAVMPRRAVKIKAAAYREFRDDASGEVSQSARSPKRCISARPKAKSLFVDAIINIRACYLSRNKVHTTHDRPQHPNTIRQAS